MPHGIAESYLLPHGLPQVIRAQRIELSGIDAGYEWNGGWREMKLSRTLEEFRPRSVDQWTVQGIFDRELPVGDMVMH